MDLDQLSAHSESLRALARRLVRDAAEAEDVVQEACLAAIRRPPPEGAPARPWLAGMVRNLSLRLRRDEARRKVRERRAARPERIGPADEAVERAEIYRALIEEVLALEEPYRSTLLLRYVEGHTNERIASRLGAPPGTVSARLHRGLAILRARLDRRFGGPVAWCLAFLAVGERSTAAAWGIVAVSTKKTAALLVVLTLALAALFGIHWATRTTEEPTRVGRDLPAAASRNPSEKGEAARQLVDFAAVDRNLDLHGTVVDAAGVPIAGARVEAFWHPWRRARMGVVYSEAQGPTAVTGSDGRFVIRLRRGQQVNLRTSAPGFDVSELACVQAGERVRVVLGNGVRVTFELVTPAGEPVPNAEVSLVRGEAESGRRNFVERRGTTGPEGCCSFGGLPAGEWGYVTIESGSTVGAWQRAHFPAKGEARIRIEAERGRTLYGTIRDAESGAPIPAARVGTGWLMSRCVQTDEAGRYELPGWGRQGTLQIAAAAEGYVGLAPFVGPDDRVDFALERACELRGEVVGSDGTPVGGALLCVRGRTDGMQFATYDHATADANGRFVFRSIARGILNTLTIAAPGHGRMILDFEAPNDGAPIDLGAIRLPVARALEGRVVFHDGSPASGILVTLEGGNADRGRLLSGEQTPFRTAADTEERRTDDLGRFRFNDLAPGSYALTCSSPGYKPLPREVTIPEDEDATGIELRLTGGHVLTVRLRDTAGAAVWGVYVRTELSDGYWLQALSNAEGTARFEADVEFRSVRLPDFDMERYRIPDPQRLAPGAEEATFVLERAGCVEGVVVAPDGRPLPQAAMRVVSDGKPVVQVGGTAFSDRAGRFRVVVPADTPADIILTGHVNRIQGVHEGELPPFGGRLTGVAAGARGLVLQARPLAFDRALSVLVLDPDGTPLEGAQVYVRRGAGELVEGANVLTDSEGRAMLQALPDGDIGVWARAVPGTPNSEDWMDTSASPLIAEGQSLVLRLRQGVRVEGLVFVGEDEPSASAYVQAYCAGDLMQQTQTDSDGSFSMLVPADTAFPLRLVAMKPVGEAYVQAQIDEWRPDTGPATLHMTTSE